VSDSPRSGAAREDAVGAPGAHHDLHVPAGLAVGDVFHPLVQWSPGAAIRPRRGRARPRVVRSERDGGIAETAPHFGQVPGAQVDGGAGVDELLVAQRRGRRTTADAPGGGGKQLAARPTAPAALRVSGLNRLSRRITARTRYGSSPVRSKARAIWTGKAAG